MTAPGRADADDTGGRHHANDRAAGIEIHHPHKLVQARAVESTPDRGELDGAPAVGDGDEAVALDHGRHAEIFDFNRALSIKVASHLTPDGLLNPGDQARRAVLGHRAQFDIRRRDQGSDAQRALRDHGGNFACERRCNQKRRKPREDEEAKHGSADPIGRVHHLVDRGNDLRVHLVASLRLDQIRNLRHDVDRRVLEIALTQHTAPLDSGVADERLA
jgi:hypothetical protein